MHVHFDRIPLELRRLQRSVDYIARLPTKKGMFPSSPPSQNSKQTPQSTTFHRMPPSSLQEKTESNQPIPIPSRKSKESRLPSSSSFHPSLPISPTLSYRDSGRLEYFDQRSFARSATIIVSNFTIDRTTSANANSRCWHYSRS